MFEWIKTFIAVYETKNFSAAAKQLYISQPTVSLQIKKLEQHFSIKLFYRNENNRLFLPKKLIFYIQKCSRLLKA